METGMEVDDTDPLDYLNFWDDLKRKLDDDMPPEDMREFVQLLRNKVQPNIETNLPSDILTFLEQDRSENEALTIIKHVLGNMGYHHQDNRTWSYEAIIDEYEKTLNSIPRNEKFVGRQTDLKDILRMFSASSTIAGYWIYGMGGMGKTTLVQEVCSRVCRKFARHWIHLGSDDTFTDMLKQLLRQLCYSPEDTPDQTLATLVCEYISNMEHDAVIVFDNIEDLYEKFRDQVESFIEDVIKQTKRLHVKVKLLFTSRLQIKGCKDEDLRLLNLRPLGEADAQKLLPLISKSVQLSEQEVKAIIADGIPLSIRLKANRLLQLHASGMHVRDEDLKIHSAWGMADCVKFAFDHLERSRQQHLIKLMIFETSQFDIDDAVAALSEPYDITDMILSELISHQLVQECQTMNQSGEPVPNRTVGYTIHSDILTSLNIALDKEQLKHCQSTAKTELSKHTLERIDRECKGDFDRYYTQATQLIFKSKARIDILFSCFSDSDADVLISDQQLNYLRYIPPLTMTSSRRDELVAKMTKFYYTKGNIKLFWFWSLERIKICIELKQFNEANEKMVETVEETGLVRLIPHKGTNAILISEYHLTKGRILRGLSQLKEALDQQSRALKTLREWAEDDLPRLAAVYNAIGNIFHDMEDYDQSYENHKEAVDVMKSYVLEESTPDMSVYSYNLGTIAYAKGQQMKSRHESGGARALFLEALEYYSVSITYDKLMKLENLISHSDKLKIRARAYQQLKEYDKAIVDAERSVNIKRNVLRDGPKEGLILGYYQVAQLYMRWREDLLRRKGPGEIPGDCKRYLLESWKWFNDAAQLIIEACEHGLSPDNTESPYFAEDYKNAAYAMSDKLGRGADTFCLEFLKGSYFKSDSDSSDEELSCPSSVSTSDESDGASHARKDSGIHDSMSSMEPTRSGSLECRQFSFDRQSSSQEDDVFMGSEVTATLESNVKRKRSMSD